MNLILINLSLINHLNLIIIINLLNLNLINLIVL